jgi:hypothetical protein
VKARKAKTGVPAGAGRETSSSITEGWSESIGSPYRARASAINFPSSFQVISAVISFKSRRESSRDRADTAES